VGSETLSQKASFQSLMMCFATVTSKKGGRVRLHSPELSDGVVGVVDRLPALLAHDAHPDVRCLDHGHVVGTCTASHVTAVIAR